MIFFRALTAAALSFIFLGQNSIAQNKYYGLNGELVFTIAETVPLFNKGFLHYAVEVDDKDRTVFSIYFFDSQAEKKFSHKIPFPKLIYLGNAHNQNKSIFLFQDLNRQMLHYVIFSDNGGTVSYLNKSYDEGLRKSLIFFYDDEAFYTSRKVGSRNSITKISYETDTIWSEVIEDKETDFLLEKAQKGYGKIYLNYTGTKLFCLDDANGRMIYKKTLSSDSKNYQFYSLLPTQNSVIIAGEELQKRKRNPDDDQLFTTEINLKGDAISHHSYPFPQYSNEEAKLTTFVSDIVKVDNEFKIIGETISKTKNTSALIGYVVAGAMAAATGVGGASPNTSSGFITSHKISVFTPADSQLIDKQLQKNSVKKLYREDLGNAGHEMHRLYNYLKVFDYLGSYRHVDQSTSIFYLSDLNESSIAISRATMINDELEEGIYRLETKNFVSAAFHMISDQKALVVISEKEGIKFKVIEL